MAKLTTAEVVAYLRQVEHDLEESGMEATARDYGLAAQHLEAPFDERVGLTKDETEAVIAEISAMRISEFSSDAAAQGFNKLLRALKASATTH